MANRQLGFEEEQRKTKRRVFNFEEKHQGFLTAHSLLLDAQRKGTEAQHTMMESIRAVAEEHRKTKEIVQAVAKQQKHTDERLNALIAVVDDIVRGRPPAA